MSGKDKWVRRFSVDETARHKNGFTIYKITSVLFPLSSPEAGTIVSVWKRFSELQRLHRAMQALHVGLALPGVFPRLPARSFFKRFDAEVLAERCAATKQLLEFIAEHRLLFASTDFVHFLQTGYAEPARAQAGAAAAGAGVISEIRRALHLPLEDSPPLEYQTDDEEHSPPREDDTRDTTDGATVASVTRDTIDHTIDHTIDNTIDNTIDVSDIEIFEAADVEMRQSSRTETKNTDSFESLNSLESIKSDLFEEVSRMTIDKPRSCVKPRAPLPDLIDFAAPSCSRIQDYPRIEDYRGAPTPISDDGASLGSTGAEGSELDSSAGGAADYVFGAGLLLRRAARRERAGDPAGAFRLYRRAVGALLAGAQADGDRQRRALIRRKTELYLAHAETLYATHLAGADVAPPPPVPPLAARRLALPARLLRREYGELALYRVLAVRRGPCLLVLRRPDQARCVIKVMQKIPNNLTEFDEYFHNRQNETKQPILPTNIPYMVALDSYIETPDLIFLVLEYAPGENLFDYIKNYVKSIPNTPQRELNLENVFTEPTSAEFKDSQNRNDRVEDTNEMDTATSIVERLEANAAKNNNRVADKVTREADNLNDSEISVNELVINSQKLLLNVSKVLNAEAKTEQNRANVEEDERDSKENGGIDVVDKAETTGRPTNEERNTVESPKRNITPRAAPPAPAAPPALPPAALCRWAAQILTALESLHNSGVVVRDLHAGNVLLGGGGRALLTYCRGYPPADRPPPPPPPPPRPLHVAPELYDRWAWEGAGEGEGGWPDCVCDFWSFGVILYELLCGVPLRRYHAGGLTSHSLLRLPRGLSLEAESILVQLLTPSPAERLGARGIAEIKEHPYFKNIDWQEVYDNWLMPD